MIEIERGAMVRVRYFSREDESGESVRVGALMSLEHVRALAAEQGDDPSDVEAQCDAAIAASGFYRFGGAAGQWFGAEPCVRIVRGRVFVTQWRALDI